MTRLNELIERAYLFGVQAGMGVVSPSSALRRNPAIKVFMPMATKNISQEILQLIADEKAPLIRMLDKLGVEKCPICNEHMIDDDANICESCNYGVHEHCTGYKYDGDGEYPFESAYAICKNCWKQEESKD